MTAGRPNNIRAAALRRAMTEINELAWKEDTPGGRAIARKSDAALKTDDEHYQPVTDETIVAALRVAQGAGHWFNAWDNDEEAVQQLAVIRRELGL